jgi:hypothetical protein
MTNLPGQVLEPILDHAARATGVERNGLEVIRAEAVTWPDGSLGCPQPGMMYIQVLVEGYWIVVRAGDEELDYRGRGAEFRLCTLPPGERRPPAVRRPPTERRPPAEPGRGADPR